MLLYIIYLIFLNCFVLFYEHDNKITELRDRGIVFDFGSVVLDLDLSFLD